MEQIIKIDAASGMTAEEAIRLNTLKHEITSTTENFLTDIGAYFKEAHDILAKHGSGQFQKFVEECGYEYRNVNRLINRYNLIMTNGHQREYLETLPTRVTAAAGSKNAPAELTQAVVNGDIKSIKELDEYKKKFQSQMLRTLELGNELAAHQQRISELEDQLKNNATGEVIKVVDEEAIEDAIEEATKEYQVELEEKIRTIRQTEELLEERENTFKEMNKRLLDQKEVILKLQAELNKLEPLKGKAEEIDKLKEQLDKRKEELRQINLDMDIYKAIRVAKENLHANVFGLATIVRAPEVVSDNIKAEIRNIHELMQNFIMATTEKFLSR